MRIWVSSLFDARDVAQRVRPARAVSLLSPGDDFPALPGLVDGRHHCVSLHDIVEEIEGHVSPNREHVGEVVRFLGDHDPDDPLLVHCWAGISRSTATAYIAACIYNPHTDEEAIATALRAASPTAFPNSRIVGFADDLLGRKGRMTRALALIGRGAMADLARPFSIPTRF